MGTHGLGQMYEDGERFADLCAWNQLVIGGSISPHKRIHKATWKSQNTEQRTTLTTSALAKHSGGYGEMCEQ